MGKGGKGKAPMRFLAISVLKTTKDTKFTKKVKKEGKSATPHAIPNLLRELRGFLFWR